MVFYYEPLENVTPHIFCMSFMMGFVEVILRVESLKKRYCKQVTIGPPSSRMPMIIVGVVMYVKLMNGPLHPIPPLGLFEKWGINLMGPLPMIRREH